jgi:alpha-mannosidase
LSRSSIVTVHLWLLSHNKQLDGYLSSLQGVPETQDEEWTVIPAGTYWGEWYTDFALRSQFTVPQDWDPSIPAVLYLLVGESGYFCHPEALVFIDGEPCTSCDRYHQEVILPRSFQDGRAHSLALIGWTGIRDIASGLNTRLYMQPCYIV